MTSVSFDSFTRVPFPFHRDRFIGLEDHSEVPAQCLHFVTEETGPERADGFPSAVGIGNQKERKD